ncbi:MAG: iron-sulfur cluster assembly scaffold protein [Desulfobacterales bacterium]
MELLALLAGIGVLIAIVGIWFWAHYRLNPILESPDGKARITGRCGDTMEIRLQFEHEKVVAATQWTNGCTSSLNCVMAAADLAKGKTPQELLDIDADAIQKVIGGLSKDSMHCAELAAETLHSAVDDYMKKASRG